MTFKDLQIIVDALQECKKTRKISIEEEISMIEKYEKIIEENDISNTKIPLRSEDPSKKELSHENAIQLREYHLSKYKASQKSFSEINVVLSKIERTEMKMD